VKRIALPLLLALVACGSDYDHTDITSVKESEIGGGINKTTLSVPEGLVVSAHIQSWDDDRKSMPVSIRSHDTNVVEVAGIISPNDYAFIGLKAGRTQIDFSAGDTVVMTIEADVTPQPE
jgi:hypothetical protein